MSVSKSSSAFNYHRICPIKTVAIIGGGSSGLITARHLIEAGLSVTVFEQHGGVGDSWVRKRVYDPENEATRPPSEAAFVPVARGRQGSRTFLEEASEDVAYQSSRSAEKVNPISSIILNGLSSPQSTETFISNSSVSSYIKSYASDTGLSPYIQLNTRVELVEKFRGSGGREGWRTRLRHLKRSGSQSTETIWDEAFDAVVVATGNQTAPFVPCIPGKSPLPTLYHSSDYSLPTLYSDTAVLIVGSGQATLETAHKLSPLVRKIWISARPIEGPDSHQAWRRLQRFVLPSNAEVVRPIETFEGAGIVKLVDGRELSGIGEVVFATGYQHSFPFLPHHHRDPQTESTSTSITPPLVTDGTTVQHLHHNTFYIPDPTLALVGLSPTSTTTTAEVQAMAISRVWTRRAALPSQQIMWSDYVSTMEKEDQRWVNGVEEKGFVDMITDWLNTHAVMAGVEGIDELEPLSEKEKASEVFVGRFGLSKRQFEEIWDVGEDEGSARDEMVRKVRTAMMRRNGA